MSRTEHRLTASNHFTAFVSGNDQLEFEYEGGDTLYHFSPYNSGLSTTLECNIIFFANHPAHARQILDDGFRFLLVCYDKYDAHEGLTLNEAKSRLAYRRDRAQHLLDNKDKWVITRMGNNKIMCVDWASNCSF